MNKPLLYYLSSAQRRALSPNDLEELWAEYCIFWGFRPGQVGPSLSDPNQEVQKDYDEDKRGDFR